MSAKRIVFYGDSITNSDASAYYTESYMGYTYQAYPGRADYPPRDYSVYLTNLFGKRVARAQNANPANLEDSCINCGVSGARSTQICYIATGIGNSASVTHYDLSDYSEQIAAFVIMQGFNDRNFTGAHTLSDTIPSATYDSAYSSPVDAILNGASVTVGGTAISTLQQYYDSLGQPRAGREYGNTLSNTVFMAMYLRSKYPSAKIIIQGYYVTGMAESSSAKYQTYATYANADMLTAYNYLHVTLGWDNLYWLTMSGLDMTGLCRDDPPLHPAPAGGLAMANYLRDDYDRIVYSQIPTVTYTATFKADGRVIDTVEFEAGASVLPRVPAVPAKTGYTGAWEPYTLSDADITINAVYTAVEPEPPVDPDEPDAGATLWGIGADWQPVRYDGVKVLYGIDGAEATEKVYGLSGEVLL